MLYGSLLGSMHYGATCGIKPPFTKIPLNYTHSLLPTHLGQKALGTLSAYL